MQDKIILAFQDNHKDLLRARKDGDVDDKLYCEGYECALLFVLSQLGISYNEALKMKAKDNFIER
jgi:hypothetical protein